jgi:rfaE bifunctional protein kinase chain/domain
MEDTERLVEIVESFSDKSVVVIGDFCLDEHRLGEMNGISREGPIPKIQEDSEEDRKEYHPEMPEKYNPGAAGLTTSNVASLGAKTFPIALIGDTSYDSVLIDEFRKRNVNTEYLINCGRHVHTYTKIYGYVLHGEVRQILRVDTPKSPKIDKNMEKLVLDNLKILLNETDALIISDYEKGCVTEKILIESVRLCNEYNKFCVGDSRSNIGGFKGVNYIVPNDYEAIASVKNVRAEDLDKKSIKNITEVDSAGKGLLKKLKGDGVIITRAEEGMRVYENGRDPLDIPTRVKEVYDVTGAGDAVAAAVTLALACGANLKEAAMIGNYAGGVVVGKQGTVTIGQDELINAIKNYKH